MFSVALAVIIVLREWSPPVWNCAASVRMATGGSVVTGITARVDRGGDAGDRDADLLRLHLESHRRPAGVDQRQAAWQRDIHLFDPRLVAQFSQPRYWFDAAALVFVIATLWPLARRIGIAAATFVALTTLLPFLNGGCYRSAASPSIVFPLFIWLALSCLAASRTRCDNFWHRAGPRRVRILH